MTSDSINPADTVSYDDTRDQAGRDQDAVSSLRDTEAESGDEDGVTDEFDLDQTEAHELGVDLDRTGGETPRLD
jgi:hypothetical protein